MNKRWMRSIRYRLEIFRHRFGPLTILFYFASLVVVSQWHYYHHVNNDLNTVHHHYHRGHSLSESLSEHQQEGSVELYQLMSKQYDLQHGIYEGRPYKKILYWNSFRSLHDNQEFGMGVGRDGYRLAGCPVWQCETSQDRSDLLQYDAILFHSRNWDGSDLPRIRSSKQRYIFYAKEAPAWDRDSEEPYIGTDDFFNWTMTYRWDSDIVHPYGWIEPKGHMPLHPGQEVVQKLMNEPSSVNYAAGKTKMSVWFVTNCRSMAGRDEMINELQTYLQVDKYGNCGNMTCGVSETHQRPEDVDEYCRDMAAQHYKFYFALENSLCLDYVSERFFATLRYPIIPIIVDAHGNHAKMAPPHSFINALDFPTVRALADYMIKLDRDDRLYNQYFWWKDYYEIRNGVLYSGLHYKTFCSLCAALHDPHLHSHQKQPKGGSYKDLKSWWRDDSDCKSVVYDGMHAVSPVRCSPAKRCL